MKNIAIILIFSILLVCSTSCTKQKMPVGKYCFAFVQTGGQSDPLNLYFEIVESTREYVILGNTNQDTLYKDGTNISGTITYNGSIAGSGRNIIYTPFYINGIYDKRKGVYYINGTFDSKILIPNPEEQKMDTFNIDGTFELKSIF